MITSMYRGRRELPITFTIEPFFWRDYSISQDHNYCLGTQMPDYRTNRAPLWAWEWSRVA